ncbi:hypothetical protein Csa_016831 [Cucumis sativus]|uniref:Uncharacterized protein n=1 Tax=Cucumis sativus TaxID=3659 RepID=A0A0A0K4H8_CUCSA|nr:hypothetical protein Csa_016831 [Cucumis sativus]
MSLWARMRQKLRGELSSLGRSHITIAPTLQSPVESSIIKTLQARMRQVPSNASSSFDIRKYVENTRLLVEATLQSPVERRRAKPIRARMHRVPSILKLVWSTLDSRLKLQYNCSKKRGDPSCYGLEFIGLHR